MSLHQFLIAAAVLLAFIAALVSFFGPQPPGRAWGHTAGWLALACYFLAGLVP